MSYDPTRDYFVAPAELASDKYIAPTKRDQSETHGIYAGLALAETVQAIIASTGRDQPKEEVT